MTPQEERLERLERIQRLQVEHAELHAAKHELLQQLAEGERELLRQMLALLIEVQADVARIDAD